MTAIRTPKTVKGATTLCERYAALSAQVNSLEAVRTAAIADANAMADAALDPLLKEMFAIACNLPDWWKDAAAELTGGKRKSIQLGGCMIGTKASSVTLVLAGDEEAAVKALQKKDWGEDLLRTKVSLDRPAILKSIDGIYAKQLKAIGFSKSAPGEPFFIKPVVQDGTIAGTGK